MDKKRKVDAGSVARLVILAVALVNTGLNMAGVDTIVVNNEKIETFVNMAFLGGASLIAWYKDGVKKEVE